MSFLTTYCTRRLAADQRPAEKVADTTPVDAANIEAIRRILAAGTMGLGGGVLAGAAMNAGSLFGSPQSVLPTTEPVTVKLIDEAPTPTRPWHGLRPAKPLPWITQGGQRMKLGQVPVPPPQPSALQSAATTLYNNVVKPLGLHNYADPVAPTTWASSKLWAGPGQLGAGALSAVGGYTAADWLLKRRRDAGMERELDTAEQEYLSALSQLTAAGRPKQAAETPDKGVVSAVSDKLKQWWAAGARDPAAAAASLAAPPPAPAPSTSTIPGLKPATWGWGIPQLAANSAGYMAAAWPTLAALPAIPAGVGMYNFMRDSGERKALQEALALRRRMRQHAMPPAIQLVPQA